MTNFNNSTRATRNYLLLDKYIIDEALHFSLESGELRISTNLLNINKFYLVMVRVLNKDSNILVYNYISYPYIFYNTFMAFIATRNKYSSVHNDNKFYRQAGDFISIFEDRLDIGDVKDKLSLSKSTINLESIIDNIFYFPNTLTNVQVFNIINRLILQVNIDSMSHLTFLALHKEYKAFAIEVLRTLDDDYSNCLVRDLDIEENIKPLSIINGCLFVVEDIEKFVESIRKYNYNINTGPQKHRGQVNSINNSLSILDMEYRNSLYNHHNYHVIRGNIHSAFKLNRDKFSFNNIHMNLGGIKWYSTSTSTSTSTKVKSKINLNKVKSTINSNITNPLISKKSVRDESYVYNQLSQYMKSLPINKDTQIKIEEFLLDYSEVLYNEKQHKDKVFLIDYDLISKDFTKLLREKEIILSGYIDVVRKRIYIDKPRKNMDKMLYYLHKILKVVCNSYILSIMLGKLLIILNINNKLSNRESYICLDLGRDLIKNYHYSLYKKYKSSFKKDSEDYTMSDWKEENRDIIDEYNHKDDKLAGSLGSILEKWMLDISLVEQDWIKVNRVESLNVLVPTEDVLNTLKDKDKMVHLPDKLPMIVKPKAYFRKKLDNGKVKEILGGYYLNDVRYTDELIKSKWNLKDTSKIRDKNVIYNLVNNINSVGFKINKDVLDFIYSYDKQYNLLYIDNVEHLLIKPKLNKYENIELESFLSKKKLQENILGLAKAYSNIHEFYLPVRLDFRGRVNCVSQYLNYQSSELAKSLLLFSKPEKIIKTNTRALSYLKAYGANCFGNKLDKRSWNERMKWVDDNLGDIINFRNGKLILQSDNKLLFIAFCFEYNRLLQSYNNDNYSFETYLPIRLDATCNGYQHLALLSLDPNLAQEVNLTKSTWDDTPKDLYSFIGTNLVSLYRNKLSCNNLTDLDREGYNRLASLEILRSVLKPAIMTKPYNVSPIEIINKLMEKFVPCDNMNDLPYWEKWFKLKDDSNILLRQRDFELIRLGLEEILSNDLFKVKKLMKYLDTIAKILTKLNLIIPWGSPSGVDIDQSYLSTHEIRLKPFTYSKKTFSLVIPNKHNIYNKKKQIQAFMPNLVHSLDAASLALLVDLYFNNSKQINVKNIFTVHDCFAVTANNVENVMDLLKLVYIKIYSESNYLRELDKGIIEFIKLSYKKDCVFNEKKLEFYINDCIIKYPPIEGVLGTDATAAKYILNSSYIVN